MSRRPDTLQCGAVTVRPLRRSDEREWLALRARNRAWLQPWEATEPGGRAPRSITYAAFVRDDLRLWRESRAVNMAVAYDGALVGRACITHLEWGSMRGGALGYWVDEGHAGRGIIPRAVGMLALYGFRLGLHRLEIAMRPENAASLRVAQKLGFREEGLRRSYLFIDGDWRDHRVFALTADEPRVGEFWDCSGEASPTPLEGPLP